MSNALVVSTILDSLISAIHTAWDYVIVPSKTITISEDDKPRTVQALPLVSLMWRDVDITFDGVNATVGETNHRYCFDILVEFPMPAPTGTDAGRISRLKATWASLLIAQVQTGPTFAGVANFPILRTVGPMEKTPRYDGAAMFSLQFECQTGINYLNT